MNRPLNPTDAALWDIERNPTLRTTIVAVLHLTRPVHRDRLLNDLEAATRVIPKLRQRVVAGPAGIGTPHWAVIDDFDLTDYVTFIKSTKVPSDEEIQDISQELASAELDRAGALWSCTYLGGSRGRSILFLKVHHSLTDGVGGIELLDAMLDAARDSPARDLRELPIPESGTSVHPLLASNVPQRVMKMQVDMAKSTIAAALHPVDSGTSVWKGLQSTLRLLSPVSSTESTLMVGRSSDRHTHVFDLELPRMHAAAHKHGCTINHLLFAGVVEGVAQYHAQAHHGLDALRVLMPVSFRASDDATAGNQWGPVRFTAPANIRDPIERLLAMRAILARSGKEPALQFSQSLAGVVQMLPSALSSTIVSGMMSGVDVVITNIPGLQEDRFLGGARVDRVYAFAPTAGAALNVALVSHHGQACIGVLSDAAAIADPQDLLQLIVAGVDEVISAAEDTEPTPFAETSPAPRATSRQNRVESPRRLSALDTAFLELETPEAPMQLGAVITLDGRGLRDDDGRIRLELARRHIEARLKLVPHFRRKLGEVPWGLGRPLWIDDEHFDISRHVRLISVPHPGHQQDLLDLAAMLHETPLDRNHPLWEIWFVDGLADDSIGVIKKVHHALIDGVGGVELMAALFDLEPNPVPDLPVPMPTRVAPSPARRLADAAFEQLVDPLQLARATTRMIMSSPDTILDQAKILVSAASELLRPSAVAPRSSFNQPIERRRVLRTVHVPLDRVNDARDPLRATVNDVVLAVLAGAFRQWLPRHGDTVFDVHAAVPVSVRPDDAHSGNHVGAVLITLPVGEPSWERRLQLVRDRMQRLKTAHDGEGVALVLDALDHVPAGALRAARLLSLQRMANLVVTNVPGPRQPMYFLDSEVNTMAPIMPLGPNMGIGVAVTSYRDGLTLGIFADPDLCPDIGEFVLAVQAQFDTNLESVTPPG